MALIMPHLLRGDFPNAVEAGRRAIQMNPYFSSSYKGYLSALGLLDRKQEAAEVLGRLLALEPRFSMHEAMTRSPLTQPEDKARYADGLRRAGLREHADPAPGGHASQVTLHSVIDLVPRAPQSPLFGAE